MKILSSDGRQFIEIQKVKDAGYSSFEVSVSIDIEHGVFAGKNVDLQFLNLEQFITDLDSFILNRELAPRLEGTYESFVEFSCPQSKNSAIVRFNIGDAFAGYTPTASYGLSGSFGFDPEHLNRVLEEFRSLAKSV